ncbi:hypothetical protein BS47DRAFT_1393210 [Hydnum rufescens UP504]|uniref:Uncharacterized protein n=1 Tax=Hydnum rufescens UP504 TaxID=1448309 RepID=A0A9P6DX43_9AGAM|nr:hypothetical protein BS47DRAFT_1393210 [Hydnum rufescens UP504]
MHETNISGGRSIGEFLILFFASYQTAFTRTNILAWTLSHHLHLPLRPTWRSGDLHTDLNTRKRPSTSNTKHSTFRNQPPSRNAHAIPLARTYLLALSQNPNLISFKLTSLSFFLSSSSSSSSSGSIFPQFRLFGEQSEDLGILYMDGSCPIWPSMSQSFAPPDFMHERLHLSYSKILRLASITKTPMTSFTPSA